MSKFLKSLSIYSKGEKRPVIEALKSENWKLSIDSSEINNYQTKWYAELTYKNFAYIDRFVPMPEHAIKERLIKDIHWQIYGDTNRLLDFLTKAVMDGDVESSLEIIREIRKYINE